MESVNKLRARIIKKEKDGVTLRVKSEVQKMSWNEFNAGWSIVDNVWAEPSEELIKGMEEINEHISSAAAAQLMAEAIKDSNPSEYFNHVMSVGYHIKKIQELANCNMFEAANLVRNCINSVRFGESKPNRKTRRANKNFNKRENKVNNTPEPTMNAVMADNPLLAKLKAEMEAKN